MRSLPTLQKCVLLRIENNHYLPRICRLRKAVRPQRGFPHPWPSSHGVLVWVRGIYIITHTVGFRWGGSRLRENQKPSTQRQNWKEPPARWTPAIWAFMDSQVPKQNKTKKSQRRLEPQEPLEIQRETLGCGDCGCIFGSLSHTIHPFPVFPFPVQE